MPVSVISLPKPTGSGIEAIVEVDIPDAEVAYASARCGMWETMFGPRFMRCGGCRSRYYCSKDLR